MITYEHIKLAHLAYNSRNKTGSFGCAELQGPLCVISVSGGEGHRLGLCERRLKVFLCCVYRRTMV